MTGLMTNRKTQKIIMIKKLIIKTFLHPSSLSKSTEEFFFVCQLIFFSALIHFDCFQDVSENLPYPSYYGILINFAVLLVRIVFEAPIIKPLYLFCILLTPLNNKQGEIEITIFVISSLMVAINLAIQGLSHIDFSFSSPNIYTETINLNKMIHNFGIFLIADLFFNQERQVKQDTHSQIIHSISLLVFALLAILKIKSKCKSNFVKNFLLRFYLLSIFYHIYHLLIINFPFYCPYIYEKILLMSSSQIIFSILQKKLSPKILLVENEMSNFQQIEGTMLHLLSYQQNQQNDLVMKIFFREFIKKYATDEEDRLIYDKRTIVEQKNIRKKKMREEKSNEQKNKGQLVNQYEWENKEEGIFFQRNQDRLESEEQFADVGKQLTKKYNLKQESLFNIFERVLKEQIQILLQQNRPTTFLQLLLAQLYIKKGNKILLGSQLCERIKLHSSSAQIFENICIYKQKAQIVKIIRKEKRDYENQKHYVYIKSNNFITILLQTSYQHTLLIDLVSSKQSRDYMIEKNLRKLIQLRQKTQKYWSEIEIKSKQILLIYSQYLFYVEKDIIKANQYLRQMAIFPENVQYHNIRQKIYIKILLDEENFLRIQKIGFNIKKLLGYSIFSLKRSSISILLPDFYREIHQTLIKNKITCLKVNQLLKFHKSIIVRHNDGYYLPCLIKLSMKIQQNGDIFMEGYLELTESKNYEWRNFFFFKQPQRIFAEISPNLQQQISYESRKFSDKHFLSDFENEKITNDQKVVKNLFNANQKKEFHLLNRLESNQSCYEYFVQMRTEKDYLFEVTDEIEQQKWKNTYYPLKKVVGEEKINELDLQNKKQQQNGENSRKKINFMVVLIILLTVCVMGLQILIFERAKTRQAKQTEMQEDFKQIIQQYNNLMMINVQMSNNMLYKNNDSYLYKFYTAQQVESVQLALSRSNAYLQKYAKTKYEYENPRGSQNKKLTTTQMVSLLISGYQQPFFFNYKGQIQNKLYDSLHRLKMVFYDGPSYEIMNNFKQQLTKSTQIKGKITAIVVIIMVILSVSIVLTLIWIQWRKKISKYSILQSLKNLPTNQNSNHKIQYFIKQVTDQQQTQLPAISDPKEQEEKTNSQLSHRKSFLQSQHSNREFLEDSIISKRSQTDAPRRSRITSKISQMDQKKQIRKIIISKRFVALWTLAFVLMLSFPIANVIIIASPNTLSLEKSLLKMIDIYNEYGILSDAFCLYLDSFIYPEATSLMEQKLDSAHQQRSQLKIEEINDDFRKFMEQYKVFSYQPICQYTECLPQFQYEINLPFRALFHKVTEDIKNSTQNKLEINDMKIKTIFYGFQLLGTSINILIDSFEQDLNSCQRKTFRRTNLMSLLQVFCNMMILLGIIGLYFIAIKKQMDFMGKANDFMRKEYNEAQK